jgi:hypothetical protein
LPPGIFTRKEVVDKPGIIGARWWQESLATQLPRRQAMAALFTLGGALAAMATVGTCVAVQSRRSSSSHSYESTGPEVTFEPRGSLAMQREYGWSFGATGEQLVFDGISQRPFDRSALARMVEDLAPSRPEHRPYYLGTLFESPTAFPKTYPAGDPSAAQFKPLKDALVPISTAAMENAFKQGRGLAAVLGKGARAKDVAVVVDLPGPEAVAFAAGASSVLDPIFGFDNWPHPRGVVPSHRTLAAAAYYQPLFANARTSRSKDARPMFVLDRDRLATYTDDATQFDNRYLAKVPSAERLAELGVKNVIYVGPNSLERQELDDLADEFFAWSQASVELRLLPATAFWGSVAQAGAGDGDASADRAFYGGSPQAESSFWTHWNTPASSPNVPATHIQRYTPMPRKTAYSSGSATSTGATRPRPANFGMVPVAVAIGTGVVLGAKMSRSGTWNRTTYTSSGS